MTHIRSCYDGHEIAEFQTEIEGVSLTHQSMKGECDINHIMAKFEKTGILEHRNTFEGQYGDFTNLPLSYHESMNAVLAAEEMFLTIPSRIRKRFGNDPGLFLEFVANPDNSKEIVEMGLATERQQAEIIEPVTITPKKAATPPTPPPVASPTPSKDE